MTDNSFILALEWQPAAPLIYIWSGAGFLTLLAVFAHRRTFSRRPIASSLLLIMRLITIAALTILLMGPSQSRTPGQTFNRPRLTILLDTSASMLTPDCGGTTRISAALDHWLSRQQLTTLVEIDDVNLVGFDDGSHPLPLTALAKSPPQLATGDSTHLAAAVNDALMKLPAHSAGTTCLLLTDGHDTTDDPIQPAAQLAHARDITIDAVCFGSQTSPHDVALTAMPMQDSMLPGEPGQIAVHIYQTGYNQARTTLHIRGGRNQQDVPIDFRGRRLIELMLPVTEDQPGEHAYQISVDPLEGEADVANNQQTVFCQVAKKRIHVLMVEGRPSWDSKFLAQSLRKDERIDLTQVTQVSQPNAKPLSPVPRTILPGCPKQRRSWPNMTW